MNEINNDMNESNISENNLNEGNNSKKKKNSILAWIIIALLAIVGMVGGFFIGKSIVNKKHIDTAKEYIANHEHTFKEATCLEAKICTDCGYTEGEALGHDFLEATCEVLSTCSRCGCTQGEYAEHDFTPANLETAKTCKICGQTEGEPVKLEIFKRSETESKVKSGRYRDAHVERLDSWFPISNDTIAALFYESEECVELGGELWTYRACDLFDVDSGSKVYESPELAEFPSYFAPKNLGWKIFFQPDSDGASLILVYYTNSNNNLKIVGYDDRFQQVFEGNADIDGIIVSLDIITGLDQKVMKVGYDDGSTDYFSTLTGERVPQPSVPEPKKLEGFDYCAYQEGLDIYLVSQNDEWGYADAEGNIISMYMDATGFNAAGYALVSDDCVTYDLIDTDFNVIATDVVSGKNASVYGGITEGSYWFAVTDENDLIDFVLIK